MEIGAEGHWGGDPLQACDPLTITAQTVSEARKLARLYRVLTNPDQRDRLFELAERIEAEDAELVAVGQ